MQPSLLRRTPRLPPTSCQTSLSHLHHHITAWINYFVQFNHWLGGSSHLWYKPRHLKNAFNCIHVDNFNTLTNLSLSFKVNTQSCHWGHFPTTVKLESISTCETKTDINIQSTSLLELTAADRVWPIVKLSRFNTRFNGSFYSLLFTVCYSLCQSSFLLLHQMNHYYYNVIIIVVHALLRTVLSCRAYETLP